VTTLNKRLRKSVLLTLLAFLLGIVMVPMAPVSAAQNSSTTVYLDPPTITGATVGEEFTVNLNIHNALNVSGWAAGLIFDPSVLECKSFEEGPFLKNVGSTMWSPGTIDNVMGVITGHGSNFLGTYWANGSGQLANLTFRVKAPGISDLHIRDVEVLESVWNPDFQIYVPVPVLFNIIDVYTVVMDTIHYKVVTVSNSTGKTGTYGSGFYNHAFNRLNKEVSFNVTTPKVSTFSNVSIPKTLLFVDNPDDWTVILDGTPRNTTERTVTENGTHYSIYFTYGQGIHKIQIIGKYFNWKDLDASLDAPTFHRLGFPLLLNATVYNLGLAGNETDVALQILINGTIVNSTIISSLPEGYNYTLSYFWTPPAVEATYNVTAYALPVSGENVTANNVETKFVVVKPFYIAVDPTSGPIGTKTTVNGEWFPPQIQVAVTFNDLPIGYAVTDEDGDFTFVFNVPVSVSGVQTVRASFGGANSTSTLFTVIDITPLEIEIDVGAIHIGGELAEFYIQTSFKGVAVNATSISALLYKPDGTTESLDDPSRIETGFYKIPYSLVDAQNGTYVLVIEASYTTSTTESNGTAFKTFLLSSTLAEEITQLETRIDAIKSTQETFTLPMYAAVVLALIAAVGAVFTIFLRRKPTP